MRSGQHLGCTGQLACPECAVCHRMDVRIPKRDVAEMPWRPIPVLSVGLSAPAQQP